MKRYYLNCGILKEASGKRLFGIAYTLKELEDEKLVLWPLNEKNKGLKVTIRCRRKYHWKTEKANNPALKNQSPSFAI